MLMQWLGHKVRVARTTQGMLRLLGTRQLPGMNLAHAACERNVLIEWHAYMYQWTLMMGIIEEPINICERYPAGAASTNNMYFKRCWSNERACAASTSTLNNHNHCGSWMYL